MPASTTSMIDVEEEAKARDIINKLLGFEPPRVCGWYMAVKIYTRTEDLKLLFNDDGTPLINEKTGKQKAIISPEITKTEDQYRNCTGLVLAQGPDCYKGERYKHTGPWCKVGDWIIMPRNEGARVTYRGVPLMFLPDDRIYAIIEDPTWITRD